MHQIDQTLNAASRIPLTDQVRFDKDAMYEALDGMRAEIDADVRAGVIHSGEVLAAVDELDDVIHNARPVPLSNDVRAKQGDLEALTGRLRELIARGNRPSPTN